MAIFLTESSKVIVQGMTGSEGMKHTQRMLDSGTDVVGGVNPRKAGESASLRRRRAARSSAASPRRWPRPAPTSRWSSCRRPSPRPRRWRRSTPGSALLVVITEGVPVHDTAEFRAYAEAKGTTRIIGPNCPGVISPGKSNAGIIPADITKAGRIGLVSKSGTLTYQMMYELGDLGFSSCIGIGGDPIIGTTHIDALGRLRGRRRDRCDRDDR